MSQTKNGKLLSGMWNGTLRDASWAHLKLGNDWGKAKGVARALPKAKARVALPKAKARVAMTKAKAKVAITKAKARMAMTKAKATGVALVAMTKAKARVASLAAKGWKLCGRTDVLGATGTAMDSLGAMTRSDSTLPGCPLGRNAVGLVFVTIIILPLPITQGQMNHALVLGACFLMT